MRDNTQTLIGIVRGAVQTWYKREHWSRETVCQQIISQYELQAGPVNTGIKFDPPTRDAYDRQRINAERIFRWLDDATKDTNLLPANFLPYIIASLPMDLRIECADAILQTSHLTVRVVGSVDTGCLTHALQFMAKEGGEAVAAMATLLDGATPNELRDAQREITEALAAFKDGLAAIEGVMHKAAD